MPINREGIAGGLVSLLLTWGCAREASPARAPDATPDVRHEDVQAWLDAWNSRDMARISALFSPDAVVHQPQIAEPLSTTSMQPLFEGVFRAFPDIHFESKDVMFARGEVTSWELVTGTMTGSMASQSGETLPPTGRRFSQMTAKRIVYGPDHKIREFWSVWDRAGLFEQLGLAPGHAASPQAAEGTSITAADIERWAAAWNSHDVKTVASLFTPDVLIDQPENPKPLDAKGVASFFGMIFRAYPDFHVVLRQAIIDGYAAVSVEEVTGTWAGPLVDPATGKSTPGNGRKFDHRCDGSRVRARSPYSSRVDLLGPARRRSSVGH